MKHSATGEPLWRDFKVRVIIPGQEAIVWRNTAKPRRGFSAADLDKMLERAVDWLEKNMPSIEFRMVELAPNRINLIYHGKKEHMSNLNACPDVARAPKIAETVCAVHGHKLGVFNNMTNTPQGSQMNSINFCSNCGHSLYEVRGDLDQILEKAISDGIQKRLQAAAAAQVPKMNTAPVPSGVPEQAGIEIVPNLKAPAPVESPS